MKLIKRLSAYKEAEAEGAIFGFGILKAMDYDTETRGHLLLFSINTKVVRSIKKLFIAI